MPDIVVFAEAAGDAEIVSGLADRVFEEVGGIPKEALPASRNWIGVETTATFTPKDRIPFLFDGLQRGYKRPRYLGYVAGAPQKSHAAIWLKAMQLVNEVGKFRPVAGVLIHYDLDHESKERREALEQVRSAVQDSLAVVLALPDREIEAWILNGFIPENQNEKKLLSTWKRKLSFDPCAEAERARDTSGDRDPKRILDALTKEGHDRKRRCWCETSLATLRQRGGETNLAAFLNEVEMKFLPFFSN